MGKIKTAKAYDEEMAKQGKKTEYGKTQTKQTVGKAVVNTVSYAAGETLSTWACAKLGAKLGTKIKPGFGTLIGAVVGFLGGSVAMWAGDKYINKKSNKCSVRNFKYKNI